MTVPGIGDVPKMATIIMNLYFVIYVTHFVHDSINLLTQVDENQLHFLGVVFKLSVQKSTKILKGKSCSSSTQTPPHFRCNLSTHGAGHVFQS